MEEMSFETALAPSTFRTAPSTFQTFTNHGPLGTFTLNAEAVGSFYSGPETEAEPKCFPEAGTGNNPKAKCVGLSATTCCSEYRYLYAGV